MRPACLNCNKEMDLASVGDAVGLVVGVVPLTHLYQVWSGDVYTCSECKARVVARYGERPMWEQHSTEPHPTVVHMVLAK